MDKNKMCATCFKGIGDEETYYLSHCPDTLVPTVEYHCVGCAKNGDRLAKPDPPFMPTPEPAKAEPYCNTCYCCGKPALYRIGRLSCRTSEAVCSACYSVLHTTHEPAKAERRNKKKFHCARCNEDSFAIWRVDGVPLCRQCKEENKPPKETEKWCCRCTMLTEQFVWHKGKKIPECLECTRRRCDNPTPDPPKAEPPKETERPKLTDYGVDTCPNCGGMTMGRPKGCNKCGWDEFDPRRMFLCDKRTKETEKALCRNCGVYNPGRFKRGECGDCRKKAESPKETEKQRGTKNQFLCTSCKVAFITKPERPMNSKARRMAADLASIVESRAEYSELRKIDRDAEDRVVARLKGVPRFTTTHVSWDSEIHPGILSYSPGGECELPKFIAKLAKRERKRVKRKRKMARNNAQLTADPEPFFRGERRNSRTDLELPRQLTLWGSIAGLWLVAAVALALSWGLKQ